MFAAVSVQRHYGVVRQPDEHRPIVVDVKDVDMHQRTCVANTWSLVRDLHHQRVGRLVSTLSRIYIYMTMYIRVHEHVHVLVYANLAKKH